jgi:predicted lactoylglutathione lyase
MKTKKILANLAVSDLDRTAKFYSSLGFKPNGDSKELISFLFGDDNFVIHFFLREILKNVMRAEITELGNSNEVLFTLAAESIDDVDNWAIEISRSTGKLISNPEEFGNGYYGFVFADPDGHKFNAFYM